MTAWWVFSPELGWQVRDGRFCGVGIVRWCRCKPGRREQVCRLELSPPFSIKVRPLAGRLSRRDLDGVSIVIDAFDQTVDPSEAQRLSNHVFVGDRLLPGVTFIENAPNPRARRVVFCQPRPSIFAASEMQSYEFWHTYYVFWCLIPIGCPAQFPAIAWKVPASAQQLPQPGSET